ncbi:hypothetical protein LIT32_27065 (plasmid) [Bacillus sp. CMF21]|nr:hypothetical protein LIT32_27065 [Bacillus sp. CMF21]
MSNQNLTEQLEVATQQFKANSPIEAQFKIGQMIEELQKSGIASGKQPGKKGEVSAMVTFQIVINKRITDAVAAPWKLSLPSSRLQ